MPEKFDFSKPGDQQKFEALPEEEKEEIKDEAENEAFLIQEKIISGETKDYNKAGTLVEVEKMKEKIKSREAQEKSEPEKNTEVENDEEPEKGLKMKKIKIPEIGEIGYFEKKVMFPGQIVKETGGVKGYIRKIIPSEELENIILNKFGLSPQKFEKFKQFSERELEKRYPKIGDDEREEYDEYLNVKGRLNRILYRVTEIMTGGDFPKKTMNHSFDGFSGTKSEDLKDFKLKKGILNKVGNFFSARNTDILNRFGFYPVSLEDNRIIPFYSLLEAKGYEVNGIKIDTPFLINNYVKSGSHLGGIGIFGNLDYSEKRKAIRLLSKLENIYYVSYHGLNATREGGVYSSLYQNITFGFLPNTKNKAMKNYCEGALDVFNTINLDDKSEENKQITKMMGRDLPKGRTYAKLIYELKNDAELLSEFPHMSRQTLSLLMGKEKMYFPSNMRAEHDHPRIPLILRHPDVPEFRWCYADYASIPTKKGWNIIEMITDNEEHIENEKNT